MGKNAGLEIVVAIGVGSIAAIAIVVRVGAGNVADANFVSLGRGLKAREAVACSGDGGLLADEPRSNEGIAVGILWACPGKVFR